MANIHKIFTESGVTYIDVPQDSGRLVVRAGPNLTTAAVFTSSGAGIFGSVDINGGTIDGTVIGGASAAAGSFTTLVGATSLLAGAAAASYPGILTIVGSSGEVIAGNTTNSLATFTNDSDASISIHSGTSSTGNIYFGRAGANGNTKGRLSYDHSADALVAYTAGSERLRIDSSGNVGIGASPTERLDVTASAAQIARFTSVSASNNNAVVFETAGTASSINLWFTNSSSDTSSLIRGDSYLAFFTGGTNTGGRDSSTERLRIDSSGRFLLGTSASGASILRIVGLPTSFVGLSTGDIWSNAGVLTVV